MMCIVGLVRLLGILPTAAPLRRWQRREVMKFMHYWVGMFLTLVSTPAFAGGYESTAPTADGEVIVWAIGILLMFLVLLIAISAVRVAMEEKKED